MQGTSIYFPLYKSTVASFNLACWRSIMEESNKSDRAESVDGRKDESRTQVDKTESGHGKTREEPCNLVSPPSKERDNALVPGTVEARSKMIDVYCIKESVQLDLYDGHNSCVQDKRGRNHFRKVVGAYESSDTVCFAEFPLKLFGKWYSELPRISKVVQTVEDAGLNKCGNTE